jgi:N-methylhydantoinase A
MSRRLRVAVDTGGTFTDFVVLDEESGALDVFKVPSTRGAEADGIVGGLRGYLDRSGASGSEVVYFSHGTTVGTNAILEENGARTGLLVTAGFRGIYEVGEQSRPYGATTYDLFFERPRALVPARLTQEVPERVLHDGSVLEELDEAAALEAIRTLLRRGVTSIAVAFLFSFRRPDHERRVGELIAREAPHVNVSLSSDVAPQIREYYRLSTTVVNAYLNPKLEHYIQSLDERLNGEGCERRQRYIMRSNGGVATFASAAQRSVQTILSGPAAGVIASARLIEGSTRFPAGRCAAWAARCTAVTCSCRCSTSTPWRPAAERSRGSIARACCKSAPRARARIPARCVTARAALSRRSPMRTWCSA